MLNTRRQSWKQKKDPTSTLHFQWLLLNPSPRCKREPIWENKNTKTSEKTSWTNRNTYVSPVFDLENRHIHQIYVLYFFVGVGLRWVNPGWNRGAFMLWPFPWRRWTSQPQKHFFKKKRPSKGSRIFLVVPGTLNNNFLMDFWWNKHFPSKGLESSNWTNHFKVDVSGTRYLPEN